MTSRERGAVNLGFGQFLASYEAYRKNVLDKIRKTKFATKKIKYSFCVDSKVLLLIRGGFRE